MAKVLATKIGKSGYSYVVQGDGLVIIHPDNEAVLKLNTLNDPKISPILKSITKRMVNGDTGVIRYDYSGLDRIVAFAPIAGVKWSLAMAAPMEEVTGSLSVFLTVSLTTIFAILRYLSSMMLSISISVDFMPSRPMRPMLMIVCLYILIYKTLAGLEEQVFSA